VVTVDIFGGNYGGGSGIANGRQTADGIIRREVDMGMIMAIVSFLGAFILVCILSAIQDISLRKYDGYSLWGLAIYWVVIANMTPTL